MKNKFLIVYLVIILLLTGCFPQEQVIVSEEDHQPLINYELIDSTRAYALVEELSSEAYGGRLVGSSGHRLAEELIINQFEQIGLTSPNQLENFTQPFEQVLVEQNKLTQINLFNSEQDIISVYRQHFDFRDLVRYPGTMASGDFSAGLIFIESMDDLRDHREIYENKVLIISNNLLESFSESQIISDILRQDKRPKALLFQKDNRKNGIYITSTYTPIDLGTQGFDNAHGPAIFNISNAMYEELKSYENNNYQLAIQLDYELKTVEGKNLIGMIQGSSEEAENILITAHYDHVGRNFDGSYNPGALDNASGVAALLEIANVIKESQVKLENNFVFIAFDGEEELLNGSFHYVENPTINLDNAVVINLDMVGAAKDLPLEINHNEIAYGDIKDQLYEISETMAIKTKKTRGYVSDNVNFEKLGVPSVLLIHMDDEILHTRYDTIDKVDEIKMSQVIQLVIRWINTYKIN